MHVVAVCRQIWTLSIKTAWIQMLIGKLGWMSEHKIETPTRKMIYTNLGRLPRISTLATILLAVLGAFTPFQFC